MNDSVRAAFYAFHYAALDDGDIDTWAADFTPDATFESTSLADPVCGIAAIAESSRVGHERRVATRMRQRHLTSMTAVVGNPDDGWPVSARSYVLVVQTPRGGPSALWASIVCEDKLVRIGSGWRIASRRVRSDDALCAAGSVPTVPPRS